LSAVTSPIDSMCAYTGNGLYQDPALRPEGGKETQTPILYKETQGIIAVIPTCDAPINDDRHPLNCSVGAIDPRKDSKCAGQLLLSWSNQESGHNKRVDWFDRPLWSSTFSEGLGNSQRKSVHGGPALNDQTKRQSDGEYVGQPFSSYGPLADANSNSEIDTDQLDNVPPSVTAAAAGGDDEAIISNNECVLDSVDPETVNSTLNFPQITDDEPASRLAKDGLRKNSHTRCSVAIPLTESSTSATWMHATHSPAGPAPRRNSSSKDVDSDDPDDDDTFT
jgi:hypothetical protein